MKCFLVVSVITSVLIAPIPGVDFYHRRIIVAEIDKAYLCVDSSPETALASLKSSAKNIRERLGRITMLPKRSTNMALDLINKQATSLDVAIRLSKIYDNSDYGREKSRMCLSEYEKSVPSFKRNIEYVRQSL